jgi:hypothetical protein
VAVSSSSSRHRPPVSPPPNHYLTPPLATTRSHRPHRLASLLHRSSIDHFLPWIPQIRSLNGWPLHLRPPPLRCIMNSPVSQPYPPIVILSPAASAFLSLHPMLPTVRARDREWGRDGEALRAQHWCQDPFSWARHRVGQSRQRHLRCCQGRRSTSYPLNPYHSPFLPHPSFFWFSFSLCPALSLCLFYITCPLYNFDSERLILPVFYFPWKNRKYLIVFL